MPEEIYTIEEAAARLSITPDALRRWLRAGKIRGSKIGGRIWRIRESDIQEFLDNHSTKLKSEDF
jgi:excisionase family DNA binding protein